jgi:hypothetical protein
MKFRRITAVIHDLPPATVMVLAGRLEFQWLAGLTAADDTAGNTEAAAFDSLKQ